MKGMEFLFVVAQVSVVYVGFATLIVVVVQQFSGARAELEVTRLHSMMFLSLLAVAFSLFPYLLFFLDVPTQTAWRVSSFFLGSLWLPFWVQRIRWVRSREHRDAMRFASLGNRVNLYLVQPLSILCLFVGALGLWGSLVGFIYLCAILVLLIMSAYLFMVLVVAMSARKAD